MEKFSDILNKDLDTTINYFHHSEVGDNELYTIGCELSEFDGEHILNFIKDKFHNKVIVSTCAVTESCKKACEVLVELLHCVYEGEKELIITGCGVNYNRPFYRQYGKTLDNTEKFLPHSYGAEEFSHKKHLSSSLCSSAQVKIQDGCNHNCAYCVIPRLKGKSHSVDYEIIKSWISDYVSRGMFDIRLIGTEVGYYNSNGMNLVCLIKRILNDFPEIRNVSLNAIDPACDQMFDLIELVKSDKRVSNKVELSVQSASDTVLKRMNRRHTVEQLYQIQKLSGVDVFYKWHLIVGFPGESDVEFEETLANIRNLRPYSIGIHPYSDRKGTIAEKMDNKIPEDVIKCRCRKVHDTILSYDLNGNMPSLSEEEKWQLHEKCKFTKPYGYNHICHIESPQAIRMYVRMLSQHPEKSLFVRYESIEDFTRFEIYTRFLMEKFDVSFTCLIKIDKNLPDKISSREIDLKRLVLNKNVLFRFYIDEDTTRQDIISLMKVLEKLKIYSTTKLMDDIRQSERSDLIEYFT